jgi:hypothetical protein
MNVKNREKVIALSWEEWKSKFNNTPSSELVDVARSLPNCPKKRGAEFVLRDRFTIDDILAVDENTARSVNCYRLWIEKNRNQALTVSQRANSTALRNIATEVVANMEKGARHKAKNIIRKNVKPKRLQKKNKFSLSKGLGSSTESRRPMARSGGARKPLPPARPVFQIDQISIPLSNCQKCGIFLKVFCWSKSKSESDRVPGKAKKICNACFSNLSSVDRKGYNRFVYSSTSARNVNSGQTRKT